jgi:hypothetical protein
VEEAVRLGIGGRTAQARSWRDEILLLMIRDGMILVDGEGCLATIRFAGGDD